MQAACQWGIDQGASKVQAVVSVEDEEKQALFEALGLRPDGAGADFDVEGRVVGSRRMKAAL